MLKLNTIRALKEFKYGQGLNEADCVRLPEHRVGITELKDVEIDAVAGGCSGFHGDLDLTGDWGIIMN